MSHLARLGLRRRTYDLRPVVEVAGGAGAAVAGWDTVGARLARDVTSRGAARTVVAVECYSGVDVDEVVAGLTPALRPSVVVRAERAFLDPEAVDRVVAPWLGGDDPVFGRLCPLTLEAWLEPGRRDVVRAEVEAARGTVLVVGTAASLCCTPDVLVYADMPRWEEQLRQRRGQSGNVGVPNRGLKAALLYKRSYFIDWRACDRLKRATLPRWDHLLDTTVAGAPRLVEGDALRLGLRQAARRPFRVVPFFDPGPWGGQWMREVCGLPDGPPNYAWCFDCVPEENSLVLRFGGIDVEIPALDLVFHQPVELLGEAVHGRFGAEFPIRFDFLDTMGGGNLSFQVHPDVDYAREHFGLPYTQDESYYILDCEPGAHVFLGRRADADPAAMIAALERAQAGGPPFPDAAFAARFPVRRHDHVLIPAGTLHCSGKGTMVLEISATPYIFTFKLWDWGRLGLDGQPRPVNIARGREVIRWERDEHYARERLVHRAVVVGEGDGWAEERTGLHEAEFIETRRHTFRSTVRHARTGSVEVLNLVEGASAVVESPAGAFAPFEVHFAETFIVPDAAGDYTVRPADPGAVCRTMKAFVRHRA